MATRLSWFWRHVLKRPALCLFALAIAFATASVGASAGKSTVLIVGDSLAAAYGLDVKQGWVAMLAERLAPRGITVTNASISGDTTAGGAARIARELERVKPSIVIIELGANDGLRGLPLDAMRANLDRMLVAAKQSGARVLLVGMRIPPNYGPDYTGRFAATFGELAKQHGAAYLPFLLEPIALDRDFYQADQLHPTASAQPKLFEHVWRALEPLLDQPGQSVSAR